MVEYLSIIAGFITGGGISTLISLRYIRKVGKIEVKCQTKLAGVRGLAVPVYLGKQDGVNVAVESPRQEELFPTAKSLLKSAGVKE